MNDLIAAAKAVIEVWDAGRGVWDKISALRDAVERAEYPTPDFSEWWHSNGFGNYGIHHAQIAWTAAQQAERERVKSLIADIGTSGRNECWDCCETILEKIDE